MRQNSEKDSKENQDDSLDSLRSKSGVGVLLAVSKEWQIAGSESLSSWMLRVRSIEKSRRTTTATHEQREPSNCEGGALENSRKTATLGTAVFLKRGYIGDKIRETKQWYPKANISSSASRGSAEDYTPKERGVTSKNVVGHQNCCRCAFLF